MDVWTSFSDEIAALAARVGPSVVAVRAGRGRGCGVVVEPGLVLTNAHHVTDGLELGFGDGRVTPAALRGADRDADVALLAADTGDLPAVEWASRAARVGDLVCAGARHRAGARVTVGTVSALDRSFRGPDGRRVAGVLEHTAPLARGSSGGPLVDRDGRLVGLNTNRLGDGFYLALPADDRLRDRVSRLLSGGARTRPRLGVALAGAGVARRLRAAVGLDERDGLLVHDVEDGSPAALAGLAPGDLLVEAGGVALDDPERLFAALERAGDRVTLRVVRGAAERTVDVSFAPKGDS